MKLLCITGRRCVLNRTNPGFHFNLGIALGKEGNLKAAIEHFREAIISEGLII